MLHHYRRGSAVPRVRYGVITLAAFISVVVFVGSALTASPSLAFGRNGANLSAPAPASFVTESYYRIRWGSEDEFMTLFRKNHLPFLRRQLEKGILLEVRLDAPHEHQPEDSRWDLRMTLVYPNAAAAYRTDKISEAEYQAIVPSDTAEARFNREERRRFELLVAHWDVNVKSLEVLIRK